MRYVATFTAQAWVSLDGRKKHAIVVSPQGPTQWDCTDYMLSLSEDQRAAAMVTDTYDSDDVCGSENTPQWIKDWTGPFYISVREEP